MIFWITETVSPPSRIISAGNYSLLGDLYIFSFATEISTSR
jgi:hypothetical protein